MASATQPAYAQKVRDSAMVLPWTLTTSLRNRMGSTKEAVARLVMVPTACWYRSFTSSFHLFGQSLIVPPSPLRPDQARTFPNFNLGTRDSRLKLGVLERARKIT